MRAVLQDRHRLGDGGFEPGAEPGGEQRLVGPVIVLLRGGKPEPRRALRLPGGQLRRRQTVGAVDATNVRRQPGRGTSVDTGRQGQVHGHERGRGCERDDDLAGWDGDPADVVGGGGEVTGGEDRGPQGTAGHGRHRRGRVRREEARTPQPDVMMSTGEVILYIS